MKRILTAVWALCFAGIVCAHEGVPDPTGGFLSGFMHPLSGWDHMVAMVAVGLWGTFLGNPAIWLLPVVFPLVMAFGGVLGVLSVPLPAVETGIAVSAVILGAMVAFVARPPLWLAAVVVGVFAIFHGHAHGSELPELVDPLLYSLGFVVATGLLHLSGVLFGLLAKWPAGKMTIQACGVVILLVGLAFLSGVI